MLSLKQYSSQEETRTTVFEKVQDFIIVVENKPGDHQWEVERAITVPKVFFALMYPNPEGVYNIEKADLNASVRQAFMGEDVKSIPNYENQEGYFRELFEIESFWNSTETTRYFNV